jgi:prostaglandin-endoperoxide synthase 2
LDFSDISKSPAVVELLRSVYEKVEDVEFYVGLFAEDHEPNTPLPPLLGKMVAVDAFSQALTNPLLSENVWPLQDKVFSVPGWKAITETSSLRDIIERNSTGLSPGEFVGMTRPGWKPVY